MEFSSSSERHRRDGLSRRRFLTAGCAAALSPLWLPPLLRGGGTGEPRRIAPAGPASKYKPTIQVTFVRRKEDYGMLWPGAIYDGKKIGWSTEGCRQDGICLTGQPPVYKFCLVGVRHRTQR